MRITILAHPEPGADETFSTIVGQVAAGLRRTGHRVSLLGVHENIGRLISGIKRRQPDLVFNLLDHEPRQGPASSSVVGLLELLGLPYTGCCPGELYMQRDAAVARTLLGLSNGPPEGGASRSVNEFWVGVIGDKEVSTFEPMPLEQARTPNVEDCSRTPHRRADCNGAAPPAAAKLRKDLLDAAVIAYRALRVRDYGMVYLRVVDQRKVEPVGVRTDCDLGESGELARSATASGLSYACLVNRIAESALARAEQHQLAAPDLKIVSSNTRASYAGPSAAPKAAREA